MKIKIADNSGFCFGVKRAVELTENTLKNGQAYISGDLVHNKSVTDKMKILGLKNYDVNSLPQKSNIVVRAHGITKKDKEDLIKNNNTIVDTTCPVLINIYNKIEKYCKEEYEIIIVGNKEHPEIIAMASQVSTKVTIISDKDEANKINNKKNLLVLSQTTNIYENFKEISDIIVSNNTNVVVLNTICNATKLRQESCIELAKKVDCMIVIGGKNSSNTKKLFNLAKNYCINTFWIENKENLDLYVLNKYNSIGITAGASTPSWIIEEVVRYMENLSKDEFMQQVEGSITRIYPKDIVKGEIIYVTNDEVIVNINYRADGIVKLDELSTDPTAKPKDLYKEGQEIEVYVIKLDDGEGNVVLSTRRVEGLKNWQKLVEKEKNGETVELTITKEVKGGVLGTVMGIVAFLPGSQITTHFVKDLSSFIGKTLECKIISSDDKKRRLVVSRKVVEEEENQKKFDEIFDKIEQDTVVKGKVARITNFGAFIDLGGIDGLIHVSDLSWNRIKHPNEVLKVGDEIEVLVLKKNREKNRISLGYKQLTKKPFENFLENNKVGDIVTATVVNLVEFGAFVRLKEGVEGLVHISQISNERIEKPSDELNLDQEVEAKILEIDPENKKIALSIKQTKEPVKKEVEEVKEEVVEVKAEKKVQDEEKFVNQDLDTSIGALLDFDFDEK